MKDIIEPVDTDDGLFHDGDPSTGVEGTIVSALTMNAMHGGIISVQRELKNILQSADINIDENNDAQVIGALGVLFQPLNNTLTAFAKLATGANKLPYFTGPKSADLADLTEVGRDILAKTSANAVLEYLQLGEAAKVSLGVDQNYVNVTSSRQSGVVYTNSTGKPILVSVSVVSEQNKSPNTLLVNGIEVASCGVSPVAGVYSTSRGALVAVVGNGKTYQISGSGTIISWSELR